MLTDEQGEPMLQGRGLTLLCVSFAFAGLAQAKEFPAVPGRLSLK